MNFFNILPGQQVVRQTRRRRRLVGTETLFEEMSRLKREGRVKGPVVGFWRGVYSYPHVDVNNDNGAENWRTFLVGFIGCLVMCAGIASYSVWELLIVLSLAVVEREYTDKIGGAFIKSYGIGTGISGVNGWLAGFLLAKGLSKKRNWNSLFGLIVFVNYTQQWWKGLVLVSHVCHFTTMLEGFMLGCALNQWGPKPKPIKVLARYSGYSTLFFALVFFFVAKPLLVWLFPFAPGYLSLHAPPTEEEKRRQTELEEEFTEHRIEMQNWANTKIRQTGVAAFLREVGHGRGDPLVKEYLRQNPS
jgi:hypothetical protein